MRLEFESLAAAIAYATNRPQLDRSATIQVMVPDPDSGHDLLFGWRIGPGDDLFHYQVDLGHPDQARMPFASPHAHL